VAAKSILEVINATVVFNDTWLNASNDLPSIIIFRFVPASVTSAVGVTAKELLPSLTTNKRLISLLSSMWIGKPDVIHEISSVSQFT
jgi:hypothetical protein